MVKREIVEENPSLIRTYSDAGFKIIQNRTGDVYDEAVDLVTSNVSYTESIIPIDSEENTEEGEEE